MEQLQRPPIFSKGRIVFCVLLVALVLVGEIVLHLNHLDTWPAFACMIIFFYYHMDIKQIPHIIIGSFFGILQYPIILLFIKALAPSIGIFPAQLLYIGIFVGAIVLLKDHIPWVFNTNAFMLFFITAVAAKVPPGPQPVKWMAIQLIGGTALVLGVVGIQKIVAAITPQQPE
ncbi:MAG: hypothetical protein ACOY81_03530 [Bacillota bacterium]|uniref:hypothetical protein n=1 Tax=Desulfurispora thermophila TaxID=265470 RepID=UPI0003702BEC|nr:hypothetical protein [Desulfurispora thermophila]